MDIGSKNIIEEFAVLNSWEEKYEHLISLGEELPLLNNMYKTDPYLVRGCQSKVWIFCEYTSKKLYFYADSDALITKGIVALIIKIYSDSTPQEIMSNNTDVFSKIGLDVKLSMNRLNGINLILRVIKKYALKHINNE